ncbi:hypothetical protein [Acinetobacter sp. G11]|uniref:hypothetical protein n=1 Tax=Acinetobacter sp. G11 TaxID=3415989 RepID=UPI003C7C5F1A
MDVLNYRNSPENQEKAAAAQSFKQKWTAAKTHRKYLELQDQFNQFIKKNSSKSS